MLRDPIAYWRRTRLLTLALMLIGLTATFCTMFFARELAGIRLFGWPLPFYMAAQGLVLLYLLIVAAYAVCMHQLDKRAGSEAKNGR